MPSVTQVLDYSSPPQLTNWFKNNSKAKCEQIGQHTANIGKKVDLLVQQDISEGKYSLPVIDLAVASCMRGWEQCKKDHPQFVTSISSMQTELKLDEIVGHPDFINKSAEEWGITDLKCTSGIRDKNWIQVGKYAQMYMKLNDLSLPAFLRVIRLQRDSDLYEWLEITDPALIRYCMFMFDHYLAVFNNERMLKEHFRHRLEDEIL